MSIVALKRKTEAKYNNNSVGQKNFSINGTHRNQGYIGQTSLSRSLPKTLMKNGTMKGHGGCCGTYFIGNIIQSAVNSTEDSNVLKTSVLNTSGMLSNKNRWLRRGYPYAVVKPDNNNNLNSQSDYITRLQKLTVKNADACYVTKTVDSYRGICDNLSSLTTQCTYAKPESDFVAISQGEYLYKLHNKCTESDVVYVPNTNKNTPSGC
jgi:hypothetical protein